MKELSDTDKRVVANLLETFVLDDEEGHEGDPIYADAKRIVERLRSDEIIAVPMRRARLQEVISLVRLEADRLAHEERDADAADVEARFADTLQLTLDGGTPGTGRDEAADPPLRTILAHVNVQVRGQSAEHVGDSIQQALDQISDAEWQAQVVHCEEV